MMARCEGPEIQVLDRVFLPHSLGSFYTMICDFIGYRKYGDEGKVMGLAPYGKDTYVDEIRKVVALKNGSFQLNMSYFKPLGSTQGMQVLPDGTVRLARHFSTRWKSYSALLANRTPKSRSAIWTCLRHATCLEEVFFHLANELHKRVPEKISPWRRLCPQQRGQRQTVFANAIPPHLDSTGRRR